MSIRAFTRLTPLALLALAACGRSELAAPADVALRPREGTSRLAAGESHTCFASRAGEAWCWGNNRDGQLGDGTLTDHLRPTRVVDVSGVAQIAAGGAWSCARHDDGTVQCWGSDAFGQLGVDVVADVGCTSLESARRCRPRPGAIVGIADVVDLQLGAYHACALERDGSVWCWGDGDFGEVSVETSDLEVCPSSGGIDYPEVPRSCVLHPHRVLLPAVTELRAGDGHSCVLVGSGDVRCWGSDGRGQLGEGFNTAGVCPAHNPLTPTIMGCSTSPVSVVDAGDFVQINAGGAHSFGIDARSRLWFWGDDEAGWMSGTEPTSGCGFRLGDGTPMSLWPCRTRPTLVRALPAVRAVAVSPGSAAASRACAITTAGNVMCWGLHLERGVAIADAPATIQGLTGVTEIALGSDHVCALTERDAVWCFGSNAHGELGDGTTTARAAVVQVQF